MGNSAKKNQGNVQALPMQGGMYAPYPGQAVVQQAPMVVQQPQYIQQPAMMQQPVAAQSTAYPPSLFGPQPSPYRSGFPNASFPLRNQGSPPLSLANSNNPASYYENDAFLSSLTGWSVQDIERLRHEFQSYTNAFGVIDREGFRKLYVASLLNMTWEALERDAESAFRNFDINQTGVLDFNEYITACSRMARDASSAPPVGSSYVY